MKLAKIMLVIAGALIITALGIDASDTLTGSRSTLLSQVISIHDEVCPKGMSVVSNIPSLVCVDTYEASPHTKCPFLDFKQALSTQRNLQDKECTSESKEGAIPWSYITRDQAMQMCARSEKRLPTSEEWYMLELGMFDSEKTCNVSSESVGETGSYKDCVSPLGAYDLVGNVWEWVSDDIINGSYNERQLPPSGYVAQVDKNGIATLVEETPSELFDNDYFWSQSSGAYGIIRGGYYDSGSDAGLYIVHADILPTSASVGIGFRCVK